MSKPRRDIPIPTLDDLFSSEEQRQAKRNEKEKVIEIDIEKISSNPNNPFQIREDEEMEQMIESVKEYGILNPLIVRPLQDGNYELVSGHRRTHAGKSVALEKLPCIVREMSDDEATIALVDSNLQREHILPSERAKAYKLKYDAIKRQGVKLEPTSTQIGKKLISADLIAINCDTSKNTVLRHIRLNELIPDLLQKLDNKEIGFGTAYELSFLTEELQRELLDVMDQEATAPSLSQARRMKKAAQDNKLDRNGMELVLQEENPLDNKLIIRGEKLQKYFPKDYTPQQKQEIIFKALDMYFKKLERIKKSKEEER